MSYEESTLLASLFESSALTDEVGFQGLKGFQGFQGLDGFDGLDGLGELDELDGFEALVPVNQGLLPDVQVNDCYG